MPSGPRTLNLKAAPWKIASLAALKRDGRLHLPDLQRGFVWSADQTNPRCRSGRWSRPSRFSAARLAIFQGAALRLSVRGPEGIAAVYSRAPPGEPGDRARSQARPAGRISRST